VNCRNPVPCPPVLVLRKPPPSHTGRHPQMLEALPPRTVGDAGRNGAGGGDAEWAQGGGQPSSPNPACHPLRYEGALLPPAGCSPAPHPHPIPIPAKSSLQVTSLTPPALSLHLTAFHLWRLTAERWGKGPYAKAAHLSHLLANNVTCPPSKRKVLICGYSGDQNISPLSVL